MICVLLLVYDACSDGQMPVPELTVVAMVGRPELGNDAGEVAGRLV